VRDPVDHHISDLALVDETEKVPCRDVEMSRRRAASDALRSSIDIGSSLFKSELTAYDLDLVLNLGQDGEVVSVDQNVSGIFEGGKQFERFVEPDVNLLRWIEFRSGCHAANFPLNFGSVPEQNRLTGLLQGLRSPSDLPT
jgi:hypothetical protein